MVSLDNGAFPSKGLSLQQHTLWSPFDLLFLDICLIFPQWLNMYFCLVAFPTKNAYVRLYNQTNAFVFLNYTETN